MAVGTLYPGPGSFHRLPLPYEPPAGSSPPGALPGKETQHSSSRVSPALFPPETHLEASLCVRSLCRLPLSSDDFPAGAASTVPTLGGEHEVDPTLLLETWGEGAPEGWEPVGHGTGGFAPLGASTIASRLSGALPGPWHQAQGGCKATQLTTHILEPEGLVSNPDCTTCVLCDLQMSLTSLGLGFLCCKDSKSHLPLLMRVSLGQGM